jgi:hypothetical protein
MATSKGNCFICGKTASRATIADHVLKDHNSGGEQDIWTFNPNGPFPQP